MTECTLSRWIACVLVTSCFAQQLPWPVGTLINIVSASGKSLGIRHCDFLAHVTPQDDKVVDFTWRLMPPVDGTPGAVALISGNYDGYYLSPLTSYQGEHGRLGVIASCGGWSDCTLVITSNTDGTYSIGRPSNAGSFAGMLVSQTANNTGSCAFSAPAGDLWLLPAGDPRAVNQHWIITPSLPLPAPEPATVLIDTSHVDHIVSEKFLGCHVDPGWTHQPLSWSSNMIYGQSFEAGPSQDPPLVYAWWNATEQTVQGTASLDPSTHLNPTLAAPALKLQYTGGTGFLGWGNRGLGSEGLAWSGGLPYQGFLWVLTASARSVTVKMMDRVAGSVAAQQTLNISGSSAWQRVNFTLTPATSAACTGIAPASDPDISCSSLGPNPGHVCVKCAGEFQVGITTPASDASALWIGFVQLEPGDWGRYSGLPVQKSTVELLQSMGVGVIRQGGTVSQTFRWKDWRGAPWARPSMQHVWGKSLVAPWGPFEFLDMCAAAGIEPVLTFAYDLNSAQDWADLVEYAWGNASTPWGSVRIVDDSHPEPYLVRTLELGNEQYNPDYVQQIAAMEAKRKEIGAPQLYYMFPTNDAFSESMAQQLLQLGGQEILSRTLPDCHVWEGGAVECATTDFQELTGYNISFINAEVNAQHSDMRRAITEAADLQDWFNMNASLQSRMRARTASFCTERSGHFDGFDQGLLFFLPNSTWMQPPGWTHAMIHSVLSQARSALRVTVSQAGPPGVLTASSQLADDDASIFVQLANNWNSVDQANVTIMLTGGFTPSGVVLVTRLTGVGQDVNGATWEFAGNTPAQPDLITPQQSTLYWPEGAVSLTLQLPAYSFTVLQVYGQ